MRNLTRELESCETTLPGLAASRAANKGTTTEFHPVGSSWRESRPASSVPL